MRSAAAGSDGSGDGWPPLPAGTAVTVVKLAPDGSEATRYPATVHREQVPAPWLAVEARWVNRRVEMDGLVFAPGDTLREYFSPLHHFNVFAVFGPNGRLRGWYANVTLPARLDAVAEHPIVSWHDLYVDVVALPDGRSTVRDEDELATSSLRETNPALLAPITAARNEILDLLARRDFPFHGGSACNTPRDAVDIGHGISGPPDRTHPLTG